MSARASRLPDEARRVVILSNPRAGARSGAGRVDRLQALLAERDFRVEIASDPRDVAERLQGDEPLRAVVAAGGDGTAAAVVNRTPTDTPLALLPLGTENLLARYVGQHPSPEAVCRTIEEGITVPHDAGRAGQRIFLLMVSAGFDAEVVRRVHDRRSGNITRWTYAKPIWRTIRSYEYPPMRLYLAEEQETPDHRAIEARWVFVVNLPQYARGLKMAPQSVGSDGLLDLCTFRRGSFWQGMKYLAGIILRRHHRLADCTMARCRQVRIESDQPVPFQVDGDPGGWLPVDVEVLPGRVRMVVPRRFAVEQGYIEDAVAAEQL